VFINVVHSSKANMMSAPSWCWIRIEISGVNRCLEPSLLQVNVTPSSSTRAIRVRPSAITSSSARPVVSMASTFLNPTPNDITWKPPLSVKVTPGQFMNAPRPPASSTTSAPGWRYRW
jgi:hypothetical protein